MERVPLQVCKRAQHFMSKTEVRTSTLLKCPLAVSPAAPSEELQEAMLVQSKERVSHFSDSAPIFAQDCVCNTRNNLGHRSPRMNSLAGNDSRSCTHCKGQHLTKEFNLRNQPNLVLETGAQKTCDEEQRNCLLWCVSM